MSAMPALDTRIPMTAEGYLENPDDWTSELAVELARAAGITLTDAHWKVIDFCRQDFAKNGEAPGIRRITKVGGIATKEIYRLFPGGPGKLASKLAGLPKPTSCV
jgi:TusE/DsrC/DsvC family sulfur relay protein